MRKLTSIILTVVIVFLAFPKTTYAAASLYLAPSSGNLTIGKDFQVTIFADSRGQDINTAEANLIYSADTLELVNLKQGSVFFLGTPASPNHTGDRIYIGGGLPTPGYNGNQGELGVLTFKPKKAGAGWIRFENGHVLLNNGEGTDVLSETYGAEFQITADTTPPSNLNLTLVGENDEEHASTTPTIQFEATDDESGIDHYEVYLNDALISAAAVSPFTFDKQTTGGYLIKVIAVDKAGNKSSSLLPIVIPVQPPIIIEKPVETPPQDVPVTVGYFKRNLQYPVYGLIFFNLILFLIIGALLLRRKKAEQEGVMREQRILIEMNRLMNTQFSNFGEQLKLTLQNEIQKLEERMKQRDKEDLTEVQKRLDTLRHLQDQIGDNRYTNWRGRKNPDNE